MSDPTRDIDTEVRNLCRVLAQSTEAPNAMTAVEVVRTLREQDPELLAAWLDYRAEAIVTNYLNRLDVADRALSRRGAAARQFAEMTAGISEGGEVPSALATFDARYQVAGGRRRRLGDMTGPDHDYVADGHRTHQRRAAFLESVHRQVALRLGPKRTEEVFTEDEYRALFNVGRVG